MCHLELYHKVVYFLRFYFQNNYINYLFEHLRKFKLLINKRIIFFSFDFFNVESFKMSANGLRLGDVAYF